jgi:putative mRNA 3-end processing factor
MLVEVTEAGLFCERGNFYIDPWLPVERAVVTHAHSDHAREGSKAYLTAQEGELLLKARLGDNLNMQSLPYGQTIAMNEVTLSLHPAGHVLGSCQVRIEHKGEVWVISGDYKLTPDKTCRPFEPLKCHTFVTESTFGLPIFRWHEPQSVFSSINEWWSKNKQAGKCSLLCGYALGKAQRILSAIDAGIGPIYTHGAVEKLVEVYRASGVELPPTTYVGALPSGTKFGGSLVIAPPSAQVTPWVRQFGATSTAFASGWMRIRGTRRRRGIDRGFVLSDHADWPELMTAIKESQPAKVIVTHGYTAEMVQWLNESGIEATSFATQFEGEMGEVIPQ